MNNNNILCSKKYISKYPITKLMLTVNFFVPTNVFLQKNTYDVENISIRKSLKVKNRYVSPANL